MELKKKLRSVSRKLATSKAKLQKEKEENEALKKNSKSTKTRAEQIVEDILSMSPATITSYLK